MRSASPPLMPIFRSRHQADLLAWLFLHPDEEYGVAELAERLRVPLSTLHREVVRLAEADLVLTRSVGRTRLVRANAGHPVASPLASLLERTFGPGVVIEEEFADLGADAVVVFGSWAARYDGQPGPPPHDIDVLVVGQVDRGEVYDAADRAQDRLGLEVNPVLRTRDQWTHPRDPLVLQIRESSYLLVHTSPGGTS